MAKNKKQEGLPLPPKPAIRHYYVDEAGDPVLFNARGKVIIGTRGCSTHFILGMISVFEPVSLETDLMSLRKIVLADSSLPWRGKYLKPVLGFHAKDDLPEVREKVFAVLTKHKFKFFAVVKDKAQTLSYVRQRNLANPDYRYSGDSLYDSLVKTLFQTRLHKNYHCNVYFSQRGPVDRTEALKKALTTVQTQQKALYNPNSTGTIKIFPATTLGKNVNLQAVDYCLWALYRYYTLKQDKYLKMILPSLGMILEIDPREGRKHGILYTRKKHPFGC